VPAGANWNGSEEMYYTAEEFEAARDGTPLPKKPAPKAAKKTATKPAAAATGRAGTSAGN
jgi:L,D-transpeptidase ErfK/SrfK